ncbi:hypothetical protein V2I52_23850 [Brenneria sp. g21c3]|uniref:hypothetical protein n=1 Tax=Brenneria sp. g21c3 TaxID=3093893 RepID=UPI002E9C758F|nr:hypothetical protein [Brenneria sp. g21c3]
MSWPIQKVIAPVAPKAIVRRRWTRAAAILVFFIFLGFYFINAFHFNDRLYQVFSIISISVALFGLIIYSLRCYKYGLDLDYYNSYCEQAKLIEMKWKDWCSKSIAIVDDKLILPALLDKEVFLNNGEFTVRKDNPALFNDKQPGEIQSHGLLRELLFSMRGRFQQLLSSSEFEVFFVKDPDSFSSADFEDYWLEMELPKEKISGFHFIPSSYVEHIDSWINQETNKIFVVIKTQINESATQQGKETEYGMILLLSNNRHLKETCYKAHLLRPLISDPSTFSVDVSDMLHYQRTVCDAKNIWCVGLNNEQLANLTITVNQQFIEHQNNNVPQSRDITFFLGSSGSQGIWLAVALALASIEKNQEPQIVACGESGRLILNTLAPSSKVMEQVRNENV